MMTKKIAKELNYRTVAPKCCITCKQSYLIQDLGWHCKECRRSYVDEIGLCDRYKKKTKEEMAEILSTIS